MSDIILKDVTNKFKWVIYDLIKLIIDPQPLCYQFFQVKKIFLQFIQTRLSPWKSSPIRMRQINKFKDTNEFKEYSP